MTDKHEIRGEGDPTVADHLFELERSECLRLLGRGHFGRVGIVDEGRAVVLPVNYVFDEGCIVFQSTQGTKLDAALAGRTVAFEIDAIDPMYHGGFSVLAYGPAEVVDAPEDDRAAVVAPTATVVAGFPGPLDPHPRRRDHRPPAARRPALATLTAAGPLLLDDERRHHAEHHPVLLLGVAQDVAVERPHALLVGGRLDQDGVALARRDRHRVGEVRLRQWVPVLRDDELRGCRAGASGGSAGPRSCSGSRRSHRPWPRSARWPGTTSRSARTRSRRQSLSIIGISWVTGPYPAGSGSSPMISAPAMPLGTWLTA